MTELLRTNTSLGTLVIEQDPPPYGTIRVRIHRMGFDKQFSRDKVTSVSTGIGRGSLLGTKYVQINLIGGEELVLKNVGGGQAEYIKQVLS